MNSTGAEAGAASARMALDRLPGAGPFGFGASSLGNLYRQVATATSLATVAKAWDLGVRYFDTAPFYGFGLSEQRLGAALRGRLREEYLVSTKVGRRLVPGKGGDAFGFCGTLPYDPIFDYSYDGVMRSFEASLDRLGIGRIDILLMHDIGSATHGSDHHRVLREALDGGFRAMTDLRDQGVVSAIGLGVNETGVCAECLTHVALDVLLVAGRYTLLDQTASGLFERCRERGVGVVAAGVFNSGILASGVGGATPYYDYAPPPPAVVNRVERLERLCKAHDVSLAAAALQFVLANPAVTTALVGAGEPELVAGCATMAQQPIPDAFWGALRREALVGGDAVLPGAC